MKLFRNNARVDVYVKRLYTIAAELRKLGGELETESDELFESIQRMNTERSGVQNELARAHRVAEKIEDLLK